ncbi:ribonuclease R [Lignipirellula cremea]|uniref:Ribonuclease R n=1 Tax=Lignipirellula cremea TaxID=2528010 RepID=A0A518E2L6_9BACT|nr:ribonuclease R [Lignipirellula cremea]QDU98312.1 Ribonuclease R [Lignipirellula cremea]
MTDTPDQNDQTSEGPPADPQTTTPPENSQEAVKETQQQEAAENAQEPEEGAQSQEADDTRVKFASLAEKQQQGPPEDLQNQVLQYVLRANYQPVKPRVIAKALGLAPDHRSEVRRSVKRLVKAGLLHWGTNHSVRPGPGEVVRRAEQPVEPSQITGVFKRASAGYGFVRPQGAGKSGDRGEDIFILARHTLDASDGDTVAIRLSKIPERDGRTRGRITEVLERASHQFVGTYVERGGAGYVQIDGDVFSAPLYVGDAGAKDAKSQDKVVVEMVRFPTHAHEGEAVIVEVLGARGAPGVDTLTIMREYGLPEHFQEETLASAREQAAAFDESLDNRTDLTASVIITIDPHDARDFDDAISLERIEKDHWRLGVHIADVAHFVPVGTPLDKEAKNRATSVYLPDRVIPMLPEVISNNLASLQPDRIRYAKTVFIEYTPDGAVVDIHFENTAIRSQRRFTYEEVDSYLADPDAWTEKLTPQVHGLVGRMHELAMILRQRRFRRGAIELTLPEIKIDYDKEGKVSGAHAAQNTVSHQIIEEFMLAANESVASLLAKAELNFLRRVHSPPTPRKLKALTTFVRELGIDCESLESRFEIQRVVKEVNERPERHAVNYAILRSMQKAIYSPLVEGHYALASEEYCHFTSPIRRYPDLTVHRMLNDLAQGKRPPNDLDTMVLLGDHCSEREQRAEAAERDLVKIKLLTFLSDKKGMQMEAVITGVEEFGLFAQGVQLPAEGLIHVSSLGDDFYRYEAKSHTLVGNREGNSYRLGDRVKVEIAHVDIDRRQLDLRLVKTIQQAPRVEKPEKKNKPSGTQRKSGPKAENKKKADKKKRKGRSKRK